MAEKQMNLMKERSTNFTQEESNKLRTLLMEHPIITCKKTDHASTRQKDAAWQILTAKFNSDGTRYRTTKQLLQKFNNIKKNARKEMAAERTARRQTGGGPAPPGPSATTEWLNSIMGESISGLPAIYDSDVIDETTREKTHSQSEQTTMTNDILENEVLCIPSTSSTTLDFNVECVIEDKSSNINDAITENYFDSSTPKSMLRRPVSKELLTPCNKRKSAFTPLETRKRIIRNADRKLEYLNIKEERNKQLLLFAKEEHEKNMQHKEEIHQKTLELMKDKQNFEQEFQKELQKLMLEKEKLEIEKLKLEIKKISSN